MDGGKKKRVPPRKTRSPKKSSTGSLPRRTSPRKKETMESVSTGTKRRALTEKREVEETESKEVRSLETKGAAFFAEEKETKKATVTKDTKRKGSNQDGGEEDSKLSSSSESGKEKVGNEEQEETQRKDDGQKQDEGEKGCGKNPPAEVNPSDERKEEEGKNEDDFRAAYVETQSPEETQKVSEEEHLSVDKEDEEVKKNETHDLQTQTNAIREDHWINKIASQWEWGHGPFWKNGSSTYLQSQISNLGFKGWPKNLPNVDGMSINMTISNYHTISAKGAGNSATLNKKKKSKSTETRLSREDKTKFQKAVALYGELFTDNRSVWDSFLKKRMEKCFNIVLFIEVGEEKPSLEVIVSLTATFHQEFVVLNVIGVKSDDSIVGEQRLSWQRKGIGLFLIQLLSVYMYKWNNQKVVPIILQVHEDNQVARPFYVKLQCKLLVTRNRKTHPFHALNWEGSEESKKAKNELLRSWKRFGLYDAKEKGLLHYEMSVDAIKQFDGHIAIDDDDFYKKTEITKEE